MIIVLFTLLLIVEIAAFILLIRRFKSGWLGLAVIVTLFVANMALYPLIVQALR